MPKRSASLLLFLIFGCIACSDPGKEIIGAYETTISTTSDFELDLLASSDTSSSDLQINSTESGSSQLDSSQPDSSQLENTERSEPEPSEQGRTLFLKLFKDHQAELRTQFLGDGPLIIQKGTWALLENSRVRTYFIEKDGKFFRDTLTFYRDGLRLVLRGNRKSITDEVNLMRVPEP
ncbi:BTB/POZ domain-containing protein [Catalinimonas niigatensis]|uniref:hypothetical protein n=1 Tax=Catalinimonas niigatensis TaxID=1397264 RepID=UPI00266693DE|nr:hypothetical protein [Catalinimonas niigatensis]WPP50395.1 hypothetical protein PZB72_27385 [Catalinimonas niigatensis]